MRLVALSDTHNEHSSVQVPDGDVLIFSGDFMTCGYKNNEVISFASWINSKPHKHKIIVAGNHDRLMESYQSQCLSYFSKDVIYLKDSGIVIDGVNFWGSPYQPWFYDWSFNVHRGAPIRKHWDKIPDNTDVLITHGPPYGVLDQMRPEVETWKSKLLIPPTEHLGCEELALAVNRVKPKIHIFGHIHGSYGKQGYTDKEAESLMMPKVSTISYNVSICNEQYHPVNEPFVIDLE